MKSGIRRHQATRGLLAAIVGGMLLSACGGDIDFGIGGGGGGGGSGSQAAVRAVTLGKRLISFRPDNPSILLGNTAITGLPAGDTVAGLGYRPADRKLYLLTENGGTGRLYTLSDSGVASLVSTLSATSSPGSACPGGYAGLVGSQFGMSFDPVLDRLRIVSNSEQNLRVSVGSGAVCLDDDLNPAGNAAAAAHTNGFGAAGVVAGTTLYVIDSGTDQLRVQDPPADGTLGSAHALGVNFGDPVGFAIDAVNGEAFASSTSGVSSALYRVNLATGAASLLGTIGGGQVVTAIAIPAPQAPRVYAFTSGNELVSFDPLTPQTVTSIGPITGLQAGEDVLGMDFRPATDDLYALGSSGRVYRIKPSTGAGLGSVVLAAPALPDAACPGGFAALPATGGFAVDFNPQTDRLRVVAGADRQNLRVNVDNGVTCRDSDANPGTPDIAGAAYTQSFADATSTQLYDLDASTSPAHLFLQDPQNGGSLTDVGSLGVATTSDAGFDIVGGHDGLVLASLNQGSLYRINLGTGAAGIIGIIGGGSPLAINGIAIRLRED
jgi:hypothetical protein